jgi:hypothetical protein
MSALALRTWNPLLSSAFVYRGSHQGSIESLSAGRERNK